MNRQMIIDNLAKDLTKAIINYRDNGEMFNVESIKKDYRSKLTFIEASKMPFDKARKVAKVVIEEATNNIISRLQNI